MKQDKCFIFAYYFLFKFPLRAHLIYFLCFFEWQALTSLEEECLGAKKAAEAAGPQLARSRGVSRESEKSSTQLASCYYLLQVVRPQPLVVSLLLVAMPGAPSSYFSIRVLEFSTL